MGRSKSGNTPPPCVRTKWTTQSLCVNHPPPCVHTKLTTQSPCGKTACIIHHVSARVCEINGPLKIWEHPPPPYGRPKARVLTTPRRAYVLNGRPQVYVVKLRVSPTPRCCRVGEI